VFVTDGKLISLAARRMLVRCCLIESTPVWAPLWVEEKSILIELSKTVGRERSSIKIKQLKISSIFLIS